MYNFAFSCFVFIGWNSKVLFIFFFSSIGGLAGEKNCSLASNNFLPAADASAKAQSSFKTKAIMDLHKVKGNQGFSKKLLLESVRDLNSIPHLSNKGHSKTKLIK